MTENRKVDARKPLIFQDPIFGFCLKKATLRQSQEPTLEQRARCRLAAVYAADNARAAMDLMYRHGGSTSFQRASRLAECWRDLHVVGQTVTIAPEWYPLGGPGGGVRPARLLGVGQPPPRLRLDGRLPLRR